MLLNFLVLIMILICYAAVANTYTYIETVGSHADSLHLAIKRVTASDIYSGIVDKN